MIPATTEGGPMSLLEGLAMGKPVIAPASVGIVPEFSDTTFILRYDTGNVESLLKLVAECYRRKLRPASLVADRSWDRWAEHHHQLFTRLFAKRGFDLPQPSSYFRFGLVADIDVSVNTDTQSFEALVNLASQYLYFGDRIGARAVINAIAKQYPFARELLANL